MWPTPGKCKRCTSPVKPSSAALCFANKPSPKTVPASMPITLDVLSLRLPVINCRGGPTGALKTALVSNTPRRKSCMPWLRAFAKRARGWVTRATFKAAAVTWPSFSQPEPWCGVPRQMMLPKRRCHGADDSDADAINKKANAVVASRVGLSASRSPPIAQAWLFAACAAQTRHHPSRSAVETLKAKSWRLVGQSRPPRRDIPAPLGNRSRLLSATLPSTWACMPSVFNHSGVGPAQRVPCPAGPDPFGRFGH